MRRALRPSAHLWEATFPETVATPMQGGTWGTQRQSDLCRASRLERSRDIQEGSRSARDTLTEREPGPHAPHPLNFHRGFPAKPNQKPEARSVWGQGHRPAPQSAKCASWVWGGGGGHLEHIQHSALPHLQSGNNKNSNTHLIGLMSGLNETMAVDSPTRCLLLFLSIFY